MWQVNQEIYEKRKFETNQSDWQLHGLFGVRYAITFPVRRMRLLRILPISEAIVYSVTHLSVCNAALRITSVLQYCYMCPGLYVLRWD